MTLAPARVRACSAAVATWLAATLVFFRDAVFSGFDTLTGDRGDARLQVFLEEHWFQVLHGNAPWRTPPMFHPVTGVVGYSDTFLLNALLSVPLRLAGCDPFLAAQLTLIALTAVGFTAMYLIVRRHFGASVPASCALAATAVFSNNIYVDTGHPQMFAVNYGLVVALLGLEARRAALRRRSRPLIAWSCAAGILLGLLFTSTYYVAWFLVAATALAALVFVLLELFRRRGARIVAAALRHAAGGAGFAGGLLVGLVPFALIYLPVRRQFGARPEAEVAGLQPRPGDLLNVGRRNVFWGWADRLLLGDDARLAALNRAVALTPLLLIALACSGVAMLAAWRRRPSDRLTAGLAICVTALVVLVLPVDFGAFNAWHLVHRFLPGGSVIRVPGRFGVVAAVLACLAIGVALGNVGPRWDARRRAAIGAALVLLAAEQLNLSTLYRRYDRGAELAALASVPRPPAECRSFYAVDPSRTPYDGVSIDAVLIAQHVLLPTLNGYSGQTPPGWDLRPWVEGYSANVARWVADHHLHPAPCTFDLATRTWALADPSSP